MNRRLNFQACILVHALAIAGVCCPSSIGQAQSIDARLRSLLDRHDVSPLDAGGGHTAERIALGQALFFDRELSGNRDTSCATCHHPTLATGDGLALPVGTAPAEPGTLGIHRRLGADREFVPRNAPEVFNRGSSLWTSMFWDSRVAGTANDGFVSPAGDQLLPGLTSPLYIQAMFPVTSRDEMRGRIGDVAVDGSQNELALIADDDLHGIWNALMDRLLAIPEYEQMFLDAYPEKSVEQLTFADAANAIGAFEIDAFTYLDSPFDRYLEGDLNALSKRQKRGAMLFYGKAKCADCHSGSLMTDQKHWSLAVPNLGPGKDPITNLDLGRSLQTLELADVFAFRTPPLRNVAETGPYMHNGAYKDLRSVIKHHSNPAFGLLSYNPRRHLSQKSLRDTVQRSPRVLMMQLLSVDRRRLPRRLKSREIKDLISFLNSLTAPNLKDRLAQTIPSQVPSGLPVER